MEKIKPYVGIWGYGGSDEIKAVVQNGKDSLDMPNPDFGGGGILEVGASGKVWKLDVDISAQAYIGQREGYDGMKD